MFNLIKAAYVEAHYNPYFLVKTKDNDFYTFSGTKINRTIQLLLDIAEIKHTLSDNNSCITIEALIDDFRNKWHYLDDFSTNIDIHISETLERIPSLLDFLKWGKLLPKKYQVHLIKYKHYDIQKTREFVKSTNLISNEI